MGDCVVHAACLSPLSQQQVSPHFDPPFPTASGSCAVEHAMDVSEPARITAVPFIHQVGGHSACARVYGPHSPSTPLVAKPYDDAGHERRFYETLVSSDLRDFVPSYHGVKEVDFPDALLNEQQPPSPPSTEGSEDANNSNASMTSTGTEIAFVDLSSGNTESGNPWSLHLFSKYMRKLKERGTTRLTCILLEDLTFGFKHPCILDVKMGTRSYSEEMSSKKRERHIEKCKATTSEKLGVRICGMQIYDPVQNRYVCLNKYHGRALTPDEVLDTLRRFMAYCKPERSVAVLGSFLALLERLQVALTKTTGYRFYSSSLLLLFEGDVVDTPPKVDVRMIDFAHTSTSNDDPNPDLGYLFGLGNLIDRLRTLRSEFLAAAQPSASADDLEGLAPVPSSNSTVSVTIPVLDAVASAADNKGKSSASDGPRGGSGSGSGSGSAGGAGGNDSGLAGGVDDGALPDEADTVLLMHVAVTEAALSIPA